MTDDHIRHTFMNVISMIEKYGKLVVNY